MFFSKTEIKKTSLSDRFNAIRPDLSKILYNTGQGYVFGCMVGIFNQNHDSFNKNLCSIHSNGMKFAKVGMVYSAAETILERIRNKKDGWNDLCSGILTGGLLVNPKSVNGLLTGASTFGIYSGLNGLANPKENTRK